MINNINISICPICNFTFVKPADNKFTCPSCKSILTCFNDGTINHSKIILPKGKRSYHYSKKCYIIGDGIHTIDELHEFAEFKCKICGTIESVSIKDYQDGCDTYTCKGCGTIYDIIIDPDYGIPEINQRDKEDPKNELLMTHAGSSLEEVNKFIVEYRIPLKGEIVNYKGETFVGDGETALKDLKPLSYEEKYEMFPIADFKNNEELNNCLKEWKKILYLDNWSIKCLITEDGVPENSNGFVEFDRIHDCAIIKIVPYNAEVDSEYIHKSPQEYTLIHELLHICFNLGENYSTLEEKEYYEFYHNNLDRVARALLMQKYKINRNWFNNF